MAALFNILKREFYIALCSQCQKIRQYRRRFGGSYLNRNDWIDQGDRIVLAEQRDEVGDICGSLYRERDIDVISVALNFSIRFEATSDHVAFYFHEFMTSKDSVIRVNINKTA